MYLRSWSEPSSDLSSLLFIKGNFLLNEKFFFFLSNVDCCEKCNQNVLSSTQDLLNHHPNMLIDTDTRHST